MKNRTTSKTESMQHIRTKKTHNTQRLTYRQDGEKGKTMNVNIYWIDYMNCWAAVHDEGRYTTPWVMGYGDDPEELKADAIEMGYKSKIEWKSKNR